MNPTRPITGTSPGPQPYPLGHSDRELERLSIQARDLAAHTTVLFRRAGISPGHRVPDIGCGPGDVSFIAADLVGPNGRVVGLDRSPSAIATARQRAERGERTGCAVDMGSRLSRVLHEADYRPEGSWVSQPSYVGTGLSRLDWFADLTRTLAPTLERIGIVSPQMIQCETLAARLVAEASARHSIVYAPRLVGVWARVARGFTP